MGCGSCWTLVREHWKHCGCMKWVGNSLWGVCNPNQRPHRRNPSDFDLSRNRSLRTLEVAASTIVDEEPGDLTHVFSTITSSVFSTVVIVYRDYDIRGIPSAWVRKAFSPIDHHKHFEVFRKLREVRGFQLVLCADVWDRVVGYAVRELELAVAVEWERMGFDDFFPEPLVISRPGPRPTLSEDLHTGDYTPFVPL